LQYALPEQLWLCLLIVARSLKIPAKLTGPAKYGKLILYTAWFLLRESLFRGSQARRLNQAGNSRTAGN